MTYTRPADQPGMTRAALRLAVDGTAVRRRLASVLGRLRGVVPRALFVVGSGRSGTDLVMTCLARSWRITVYNEDHPQAFENWRLRDLSVIERLLHGHGTPIVAFKPSVETDRTRELLDRFVTARALFVIREPWATVRSRARFFADGQVAAVEKWIARGFERFPQLGSVERDVIVHAWATHPTVECASAIAWYAINSAYWYLSLHEHPRVHMIQYERLLQDPAGQLAQLCRDLGVPYHPLMATPVGPERGSEPSPQSSVPTELRDACDALWQRFQAPAIRGTARNL